MSGKYIVYLEDRKGKEYDGFNDQIIFKGEYLNGRRNGKGKEYYNHEYNNEKLFSINKFFNNNKKKKIV